MAKKGEYDGDANHRSKRQRSYQAQPEQKKNRVARNKARREALRSGKVSKGDNKEIDHKTPLSQGGSKSASNTRVLSKSPNRRAGGKIGGARKAAKGK
jgi:5-methylcytosine-specific restriction endonuclease McrA